ncbi:MAG: DUF3365 domain-containing protein [Desulfohalobiaceae bacterium]|nr:DUF3365 domain-containing protein [Desulfohalobiaceae bacterium]
MHLFRSLSLQTRFIIGLLAAALVMGFLFAGILFLHLQNIVITEVSDRANAMLDQVNAVQGYVRNELRPKMFQELPEERFVLEAMSSSYISRKIMETATGKTDFRYRRVALNPRNPDSRPNDFEQKLITHFQKNPDRKRWEKMVDFRGEKYYFTARPVVFKANCLHCHGSPVDAPRELLARYGREGGFGHEPGQAAGVVSIGFPLQQTVKNIKDSTFAYLLLYLVALLLFFSLVQFHFRRLVVDKLQKLGRIFQSSFPAETPPDLFKKDEHIEVDEMIQGLGQMATDLSQARKQLKNYADNLENMVEERTLELDREVIERRADVQLFIDILNGLRSSGDTAQLLRIVLKLLADRLKAERIIYYCTQYSTQVYQYPIESAYPELPESFPDFALEKRIISQNGLTFVPVRTRDQLWGVLGVSLPSSKTGQPAVSDQILLAFGEQLAVALENIQTLNNLLQQKNLLDSVFQGISDPIMLLDKGSGIVLANQGARSIFQTGEQPELKRSLETVLGLKNVTDTHEPSAIAETIRKKQPWSKEVSFQGNRFFQLSLYPLPDVGREKGDQVVCSIRETTMEKLMAARMQRAEKLSSVGKLAAGLAHEINNPLGTIQCYINLLKDELPDGKKSEDLQVIERQTKRAQSTVQELLDFARPRHPQKIRCNLNRQIRNFVDFFLVQADKKKIRLETDLQEDLPPFAGDPGSLEQVFSNLILNGLDAVGSEGWILFKTRYDENSHELVLSIQDSGPGISEDQIHRIFDPFYTTKDVGQGTGLGLAIVYGLVEEMGGRIEVDNLPGATFTITFPASDSEGCLQAFS